MSNGKEDRSSSNARGAPFVDGATIGKITYGWDGNGNITSKTTLGFARSAANSYSYDRADRLTSWDNASAVTVYDYDAAGNRLQAGAKMPSC